MKRRHFLGASTLTTLSLVAPRRVFGSTVITPADRLFIFIDANGAWDPTMFCDPKAHPDYVSPSVFTAQQIKQTATGIQYAPYNQEEVYKTLSGDDFFQVYSSKMRVINGVDNETNNHTVGSRNAWSGRLGEGQPALAALIGAIHSETLPGQLPLAFLSTGGYDSTNTLVPAVRIGNTKPLTKLTETNRLEANNPLSTFHNPEVLELIRQKQTERTDRLINNQGLPQIVAGLERLKDARASEAALSLLKGPLNDTTLLPEVSTTQSPLLPSARIALGAMAAGVCVSANLSMKGFDTHGDHDALGENGHRDRLGELVRTIDYVWARADALGFAEKLVMVVSSDFGRTVYNQPVILDGEALSTPGKDHWPITSLLCIGNDFQPGVTGETSIIEGAKGVIGAPVVASGDGLLVAEQTDSEAQMVRQVHVHHALRCLAGIKDHPLSQAHPVHRAGDTPLPLFAGVSGWENF